MCMHIAPSSKATAAPLHVPCPGQAAGLLSLPSPLSASGTAPLTSCGNIWSAMPGISLAVRWLAQPQDGSSRCSMNNQGCVTKPCTHSQVTGCPVDRSVQDHSAGLI